MREWLKAKRDEKGLSQQEMASKLNITQQYYCDIENNKRQRRLDLITAWKLSKVLGMTLEEIIIWEAGENIADI